MNRKRRTFSASALAKVWDRQNGICACGCNEPLEVGHVEYDHATSLWTAQTEEEFRALDTLNNLRALIRKHHLVKTIAEAGQRAKEARQREKFQGRPLTASERELAKIMERTKQVERT